MDGKCPTPPAPTPARDGDGDEQGDEHPAGGHLPPLPCVRGEGGQAQLLWGAGGSPNTTISSSDIVNYLLLKLEGRFRLKQAGAEPYFSY